jgi:hypothetical protein
VTGERGELALLRFENDFADELVFLSPEYASDGLAFSSDAATTALEFTSNPLPEESFWQGVLASWRLEEREWPGTIAAWIKPQVGGFYLAATSIRPDLLGGQQVLDFGWEDTAFGLSLLPFGLSDRTFSNSIPSGAFSQELSLEEWVHVVITRDRGGNILAFVNGSSFPRGAYVSPPLDPSGDTLYLVAAGYGGYFEPIDATNEGEPLTPAKIDNVRLYRHALSPEEVQSLYEQEREELF